jgi:hypothetical protein
MTRLGMRQEAHHVESYLFRGEWVDQLVFAVLATEWRAGAVHPQGSGVRIPVGPHDAVDIRRPSAPLTSSSATNGREHRPLGETGAGAGRPQRS